MSKRTKTRGSTALWGRGGKGFIQNRAGATGGKEAEVTLKVWGGAGVKEETSTGRDETGGKHPCLSSIPPRSPRP